jgi:agmatinase
MHLILSLAQYSQILTILQGLILNSSIHAAVRAPVMREKDDLANDHRCGFSIITARDIDLIGAQGIIDSLKKRVGNHKVYISLDIDSLDPAFAPGMLILKSP